MTRFTQTLEHEQIREICRDILDGRLGVIEGVRKLVVFAHSDVIADKEDCKLIVAIDSETDHLPVGAIRELWAAAALLEKDTEIMRLEAIWRERLVTACKRVLNSYQTD